MPWYFFAAAPPVLYSITNYIDKFLIEKRVKDPLGMTALSSVVSGIFGFILIAVNHFTFLGTTQTILAILAGILLAFYLIPYFSALKSDDTSRVVPLFQFIPVFTLILSAVFLKETLAPKQILGLILVVIAGIFLSAEKIEAKIFKPRKSLWLMLLSGFMYGSVGILFRSVSKDAGYWVILGYEYIGTGIAGMILLTIPKIRHSLLLQSSQLKSSFGVISINNVIAVLAQMSEAFAVTLAAVPLVNLVGGIQPLVVLIFGLILTLWFPHIVKEDIRKVAVAHKLISVIIIFIGLYLVNY